MQEPDAARREARYGMPSADQLLVNRQYVIGYSYLFRQPRWALQLIDPLTQVIDAKVKRSESRFREDFRLPEPFRATPKDYSRSGYDRGHLVSSADRRGREVVNSETFLMSNICPQAPRVNRRTWLGVERAVRELAEKEDVLEVYAISGPLFSIGGTIAAIGASRVMIPSAYFKSVLAETRGGGLKLWSFIVPNTDEKGQLEDFLVPTVEVESRAGLLVWDRLRGPRVQAMKTEVAPLWSADGS